MKMLKRILYSTHRVLGTILSILFLLWFLSGMVMIYHSFPKVKADDRNKHTSVIKEKTANIASVFENIPQKNAISQIRLAERINKPVFSIKQADKEYHIDCNANLIDTKISFSEIEQYAQRWNNAAILRVDSLYELEQWIPFARLKNHFPIYKFHFADKEKHQLYISSKTGEALQFTNKKERFWAWLGAIPHWIYFTSLRQETSLWSDVVVILSGLGSLMCLFGIIIGISAFIKKHKKTKRIGSPYGKWDYKWHHILGFFFGVFVFTFVFSGMMSMLNTPQWLVKTHNASANAWIYENNKNIRIEDFKSDYNEVFKLHPNDVKTVEWSYWADIPIYKVLIADSLFYFDASKDQMSPFTLNKKTIEEKFSRQYSEQFVISELNNYDNYYIERKRVLPLPVYKVEVDSRDNCVYYINPKTAETRYFNSNRKALRWMYKILHTFNISFFSNKTTLWSIFMWTLLIGGTAVSLTGVTLSYKFLKRKTKQKKKKRN